MMPEYTPIDDTSIKLLGSPRKPGLNAIFTLLRDNPVAVLQGATGAPRLQRNAIPLSSGTSARLANNTVKAANIATGPPHPFTAAKIESGAVDAGNLGTTYKETTTTGETSVYLSSNDFRHNPYCFMPRTRRLSADYHGDMGRITTLNEFNTTLRYTEEPALEHRRMTT